MKHTGIFAAALFCLLFSACQSSNNEQTVQKPNIIIFYVDDLGYGDLSSYGSMLQTPHVDALAAGGIRFTDGHSSSATCTPSRYSLLTGEFAFRNDAAILPGDAPLLIPTDKPTLPKMLKKAGYQTAVVGKWHLGLGDGNIDWNGEVKPGPLEIGFDYSFLLPSTGDRVPSVYLENHHVVGLAPSDTLSVSYKKKIGKRPTGNKNPELTRYIADRQHGNSIINGVSRIGYMSGGQSAEWIDEEFPDRFVAKAEKVINEGANNPFFLFFSFHDIHVPRLPQEQFIGKSGMGVRGDAILQMDWTVGQVMQILKDRNLEENTLVIFTSDNGPVLDDGYADESVTLLDDHQPSGIYRGGKYSAYEASTRVPTIAYWPGTIEPQVSDALISQLDFYESFASMVGQSLGAQEALDSEDLSSTLLGQSQEGRIYLVEESATLALRKGNWKYIRPFPDEKKYPEWIEKTKDIPDGLSNKPQLYNLAEDPKELDDLATTKPEMVKEMQAQLKSLESKTSRK